MDTGINFGTLMDKNPLIFQPLVVQPTFPSTSTSTPDPSSTPGPSLPNYDYIHSIRPTPNRSRHGQSNIDKLRAQNTGLKVNAKVFMQRLLNNATTTNKDIALLVLATNGIIDIQDETLQESPTGHVQPLNLESA